jgi:hypothetical protein
MAKRLLLAVVTAPYCLIFGGENAVLWWLDLFTGRRTPRYNPNHDPAELYRRAWAEVMAKPGAVVPAPKYEP